MMPIAECRGVVLYSAEDGFLSFTNSPYYGHRHLSSVDLYPRRGVDSACSPIEGTVLEARKLRLMNDYIIVVATGVSETCVKILHVEPEVEVGDHLAPGDVMGRLVWSPFFNFWTDRHMHVEVRSPEDRLRAKGGYALDPKPLIEKSKMIAEAPTSFRVGQVLDRYTLLRASSTIPLFATPLPLEFGGILFSTEGGLPHYGHGALWSGCKELCASTLELIKRSLSVDFIEGGYIHFVRPEKEAAVNGQEYRGIGLYLSDPHVKLIPRRLGRMSLEVGDEISRDALLSYIM